MAQEPRTLMEAVRYFADPDVAAVDREEFRDALAKDERARRAKRGR